MEDPSLGELVDLLVRLEPGGVLKVGSVDTQDRWEIRVLRVPESATYTKFAYFMFWRDSKLGKHSGFDSDDTTEVAERMLFFVTVSADART